MKLYKIAAKASLALTVTALSASASVKDLPVRTINGKVYHYYEVPAKETVYSLCYKLGITKDELVKNNPSVADGLKKGMVLFFPMDSDANIAGSNTATEERHGIFTHHVERGETIFGIARKYGVTTDQVIAQNPILSEGLKAGQTLTINTTPATQQAAEPIETTGINNNTATTGTSVEGYIVKKKETLYSIAHENNLTIAELEAANPGLTTLKAGQVINIPVRNGAASTNTAAPTATGATESSEQTAAVDSTAGNLTSIAENRDSIQGTPAETVKKDISVAVLLPFMLEEETPSKSAQRCTEFYKGFLLAVDSLRSSDRNIRITAFDTQGSTLRVKEFISSSDTTGLDAIIAPDNSEQLSVLAQWGKQNGVKIFNTFVVRNDDYMTNPAVMQSNLPSALMHRKAIDGMVERLRYSTSVFISINNTTGDKTEFVKDLKKSLDAAGTTYMDVTFDGRLTAANLKALPADGNYTFIPLSGKQADLNKIMPGILEWRDEAVTPTVKMFGYPEWITFRGETLENMHKLNTTVYSRFYADEESARYRDIDTKFHTWYGKGMEAAVPRQGVLGFDTGMFILNYLGTDNTHSYEGVQNGYRFAKPADTNSGMSNEMLYFINFRPGGMIEKYTL